MDPGRIAVAGDWHGNTRWACYSVEKISAALTDEPQKLILHAGDFGIWPGRPGQVYLTTLTEFLKAHDIQLWFIDGNHEDFDQLNQIRHDQSKFLSCPCGRGDYDLCLIQEPVQITSHITWLPRGCRWQWHGKTWLAMGGAASVDRAWRVDPETIKIQGIQWWPGEYITPEQITAASEPGHADVIISHDAPSMVFIPSIAAAHPEWHPDDLERADQGRKLLQKLGDAVTPSDWIHGHWHRAYQKPVQMTHGPVTVTGLDMDGKDLNWLLLQTEDMTWEVPDVRSR